MSTDMLSTNANLGTDGDVTMDDDRKLSADLDKRLRIQEPDDFRARGPSSPKKENLYPPCRYTGVSTPDQATINITGELGHDGGQNHGFLQQDPASWGPYRPPHSSLTSDKDPASWGPYRPPHSSLTSDTDLETDRDQSITHDNRYIQTTDYSYIKNEYLQTGGLTGVNYPGIIQPSHFEPQLHHHGYKAQQGQGDCYPNGNVEYKPDVGLPLDDSLQKCQTTQAPQNPQPYMPGGEVAMATDPQSVSMVIESDEQGECALHVLSVMEDTTVMADILDTLQKYGVIDQCINLQNKAKQTPLFLAVQAHNVPLVGWLLQNLADPNIQGTVRQDRDVYVWRAPLHLAAMAGDAGLGMLRMLIRAGADVNTFTIAERLTPLHVALKCHSDTFSCHDTILELIKAGAMNPSITEQSSSKTPLIMAIETRDLGLVRDILDQFDAAHCRTLLLEQTRSGDTCLHIAAGLSRISTDLKQFLLRLLIIKGANGNIVNNIKEFPRDYARLEWDKIRTFTT